MYNKKNGSKLGFSSLDTRGRMSRMKKDFYRSLNYRDVITISFFQFLEALFPDPSFRRALSS